MGSVSSHVLTRNAFLAVSMRKTMYVEGHCKLMKQLSGVAASEGRKFRGAS